MIVCSDQAAIFEKKWNIQLKLLGLSSMFDSTSSGIMFLQVDLQALVICSG